ncbi:MAG: hypothetical protein FWE21_02000 [Defluviitaleaceae bacterium]|nr:hypothetical protein [Defluviitaleaceae bacterium]
MTQQLNLHKVLRIFAAALIMMAGLAVFTACDGPNSSAFTVSVNHQERTLESGFSATADRIDRGHRNRTFNLNATELRMVQVFSTVGEGDLTLTISQNGEEDGTEIVLDLSEGFMGHVDTSSLSPGRIRFSLRYSGVRDVSTTVTWN